MTDFTTWYNKKLQLIDKYGDDRFDKFSVTQQSFRCTTLPLLHTKATPWQAAIREMLWFISPSMDYADLHNAGCRWWSPWLQQITGVDLSQDKVSTVPVTTAQLPYKYHAAAFVRISDALRAGDTASTRLVANLWPTDDLLSEAVLPPCAYGYQLTEYRGQLSMTVQQRSADLICGVPTNVLQYWFLLELYAKIAGLQTDSLVMNFGDLHVYKTHTEQPEWLKLVSTDRAQYSEELADRCEAKLVLGDYCRTALPNVEWANTCVQLEGNYQRAGSLKFPVVQVHVPKLAKVAV